MCNCVLFFRGWHWNENVTDIVPTRSRHLGAISRRVNHRDKHRCQKEVSQIGRSEYIRAQHQRLTRTHPVKFCQPRFCQIWAQFSEKHVSALEKSCLFTGVESSTRSESA